MSIDPQKIEVSRDYPKPTSTRKVRQCMGFLNYCRKFCEKFSETASPISNLLKNNIPFVWSPQCQTAFEQLKIK
jgi:hypothetical protein